MTDTHQKALEINLNAEKYGSFAEIGAGQEVARWFFRVGGASGTIAKTISAYDMTVSDAIYGPCGRYVSRERLQQMLDHEFKLLQDRLSGQRGETTSFFVFSDTVVAKSYSRNNDTHGWMGIKFQAAPGEPPSQVIIHLRMLDSESLGQQEALGILGVNLIHAALVQTNNSDALRMLLDGLSTQRVEVDMIEFSGAAYSGVDNRLMSLALVQKGLSSATMINARGEVVQPAAVLYKKPILLMRGSFRPLTKTMVNMLDCALAQFIQEPEVEGEEVVVLAEMTLKNLMREGEISHDDFLARADILGAMGKTVLITNYSFYYSLAEYLFGFTKKPIGLAMGVPTLKEVFNEKYYDDLPGGILASFGRLFEKELKVYVYPQRDVKTGALVEAANLLVSPHLRHLYAYLCENRFIEPIRGYTDELLPYFAKDVLAKINAGDPSWKEMVPEPVAEIISTRGLWR